MRRPVFAAFIALLGSNALAQAQTPQPEQANGTAGCALPAVADQVALEDVSGSDLVTVPVEINGQKKQFLLDIGSNATEVSQALVDELQLVPGIKRVEILQTAPASQNDTDRFRIMNLGSVSQVTIVDVKADHNVDDGRVRVNIPAFTIGNATGRNLTFVVANQREIADRAPYGGLLTGSFFKQYDVELDFEGGRMTWLTPAACSDPDKLVFWPHSAVAIIPFTLSRGKIEVQVSIQGHIVNALFDTSSPQSVMRYDIAELGLGLRPGTPAMMPDGDLTDGRGLPVYKAFLAQISFAGGVTAINVPVQIRTNSLFHHLDRQPTLGSRAQYADEPRIPDFTLGMDVLRQLHMYVVYGQSKVYVTSAE